MIQQEIFSGKNDLNLFQMEFYFDFLEPVDGEKKKYYNNYETLILLKNYLENWQHMV
jgi:hypothetical protein